MYKIVAEGSILNSFFFPPTRFTLLLIHVKIRWKHLLETQEFSASS